MNKLIKIQLIILLIIIFFSIMLNCIKPSIQINLLTVFSKFHKKYFVGEKYKIRMKKFPYYKNEKIYVISLNNRVDLFNGNLIMNSAGRECLIAYVKNFNSSICFDIYNTPNISFQDKNPLKIELYTYKQLKLELYDYPKENIKYVSNDDGIITVNEQGIISAMRPGRATVIASGLDNRSCRINIIVLSNNGLINNSTLEMHNVNHYKNLMIVAHPDDEILWGGANLYNEKYFVVCLTNGYTIDRANDFREILKFTNNSGIILNYPDLIDNINRDDWTDFKIGIIKDLSIILTYNKWIKIVTHGPDGTTGHIHHKKLYEYVTMLTKKYNIYNNLYYFGKFYNKNEMPTNLSRINDRDFDIKKKEVEIYKSVKYLIYKLWYHFLPYENWILASKLKIN